MIAVVSYAVALLSMHKVVAVEHFIDVGNILGKSWVALYSHSKFLVEI